MTTGENRTYDIVVFGATSFVGRILSAHLNDRHGGSETINWAIAGRDRAKLDALRSELGLTVDQIIADAHDIDALATLAESTRVIISTVGPYSLYGSELVEAAAIAGTDY